MNFKELNNSLPNGLHDAHIYSINIDYVSRRIDIIAEVWVGNIESKSEFEREEYKKSKIIINNFQYIVIDPPDPKYDFNKKESLWIDAGDFNELKKKPILPQTEKDHFQFWIFVQDWNSFIYIASENIELKWN